MATTIPTPAELAGIAQAAVRAALDPTGTGAVDLQTGSRNDVLVSVATTLAMRNATHLADRIAANSPKTAQKDDLDILAGDVYGDVRRQGIAATGLIPIYRTNTAATVIPKGSRFSVPQTPTQPAVVFQAASDFPVASGIIGNVYFPLALPVICSVLGVKGNVATQLVTAITDSLPDTSWVIAPPPAGLPPIGGGLDLETDAQLQARLVGESISTQKQRGTLVAIVSGALRVPGVAFVTAVEPQDGTIVLYVGDANYMLSATLQAAVLAALAGWRTGGIPVVLRAYSTSTVQVTANIYMQRDLLNYNIAAIQQAASAAVLAYFAARLRPDEYYLDRIRAAIGSAALEVQNVTLSLPASDQQRPADTAYGNVTSLNRYIVTSSSISITVNPPLHS